MSNTEELRKRREALLKETKALETEIETIERKARADRNKVVLENIDALLTLTEHSRTSCSDEDLKNRHRARCPRCALLSFKRDEYIPDDFEFDIGVRYLGSRDD